MKTLTLQPLVRASAPIPAPFVTPSSQNTSKLNLQDVVGPQELSFSAGTKRTASGSRKTSAKKRTRSRAGKAAAAAGWASIPLLKYIPQVVNTLGPTATTVLTAIFPWAALVGGVGLAVGLPLAAKFIGIKTHAGNGRITNAKQVIDNLSRFMGKPLAGMVVDFIDRPGTRAILKDVPQSTVGKMVYFSKWRLFFAMGLALKNQLKKVCLIGPILNMVINLGIFNNMRESAERLFSTVSGSDEAREDGKKPARKKR